jgi:hypothetical protein
MMNPGPTEFQNEDKAHAMVARAATLVREYLKSCGVIPIMEEIVADGDGGTKVCVLNINFSITGKEVSSERRAV